MFDYKQLFGFATILFGIGFILQSIMPAIAKPSGPSISLGGNPYRNFYTTTEETVFTTSATETFIITTIIAGTSGGCQLHINGSEAIDDQFFNYQRNTAAVHGNIHLTIGPNSTVSTWESSSNNCLYGVYIDGYYTHW